MKEEVIEMKKEIQEIKTESFAMELYKDSISKEKRNTIIFFIIWLLTFGALCIFIYLYFDLLSDIGVIETTTITQDNENGYNNYIGNDGDITNGKADNKEN